MKQIVFFLLMFLFSAAFGQAQASTRLDAYVAAYHAGTLYIHDETYQAFFAAHPERKLVIEPGPATPTRDLGTFVLQTNEWTQAGIILIIYDEATQQPLQTRTWPLQRHSVDQAVAGQAADIASTAVGLALGATEMNPIFGPIINDNPVVGLFVLGGFKYALILHAESQEFELCVSSRAQAARLGYAYGAHNIAGFGSALLGAGSAALPIGLIAGIAAYSVTGKVATEDSAIRCFEAQEHRNDG